MLSPTLSANVWAMYVDNAVPTTIAAPSDS
ncbi:Uncharacterised protein [Mycobacteroides abscessus subsp. abscessus]|nr:Uncharacterised protein [Mycobacteroides abscessus subsp. abscessus]